MTLWPSYTQRITTHSLKESLQRLSILTNSNTRLITKTGKAQYLV